MRRWQQKAPMIVREQGYGMESIRRDHPLRRLFAGLVEHAEITGKTLIDLSVENVVMPEQEAVGVPERGAETTTRHHLRL